MHHSYECMLTMIKMPVTFKLQINRFVFSGGALLDKGIMRPFDLFDSRLI